MYFLLLNYIEECRYRPFSGMIRNSFDLVGICRIVNYVCFRISLALHTHGGRASAIQIDGILGVEVFNQETSQFLGRHASADVGTAAIDNNHQQMVEFGLGQGRAWMGIGALVCVGIFGT